MGHDWVTPFSSFGSFGSPLGHEPQEEESVATYDSERFGSFGSSLGHPQELSLGHLGLTPIEGVTRPHPLSVVQSEEVEVCVARHIVECGATGGRCDSQRRRR